MNDNDLTHSDPGRDPSSASESVAPEPSGGAGHTIIGAILLAIGIAGIIFFFGRPTPSDEAEGFALWNTVIVIGSAVFGGIGAYLLMRGVAHRRRQASRRR
ncbi:MAG: hypothetical protein KIT89_12930 [Microcella sp.]|uniref:hypothetical protein n=1 Tax=Microcella sp. TaxID=1913979 RepID=UPI0024CAA563|nr:hypothetical protein [Microcella sp.]UYN83564.1 MAG: hypothetical protein KIT89_12930 [Microcella sp.]